MYTIICVILVSLLIVKFNYVKSLYWSVMFVYKPSNCENVFEQKGEIEDKHVFLAPVKNMLGKRTINESIKYEREGKIEGTFPYQILKLFKGSMATESGERHKQLRSVFLKYLCPTKISNFYETIEKYLQIYIINNGVPERSVLLQRELRNVTFSVICESLLGEPIDEEYTSWMNDFNELTNGIICIPIMLPGFGFYKAEMARRRLQRKVEKYMEERDNYNEFLEEVAQHYTDKESMAKCVLGFIFAGFDTTASLLSSTITMMLQNDYIEKCRNDNEMIKLCIRETLRLHPPAIVVTRRVNEDIEFLNKNIKAGAILNWVPFDNGNMNGISREFFPERYLNERELQEFREWNNTHIQFGFGSRRCLGMNFALKEAEYIIKRIVSVYDIKASKKLELYRCPITHEKNYLPVVLKKCKSISSSSNSCSSDANSI